jgi:hypothetical protein
MRRRSQATVWNMRFSILLCLLAGLLPGSTWADWNQSARGRVGGWEQGPEPSFAFTLENGEGALVLCPNITSGWDRTHAVFSPDYGGYTTDGAKAFMATLMEARLSGRTVTFYLYEDVTRSTCFLTAVSNY